MNLSAILVVVPASEVAGAVRALAALPGVEVHHADPPTGRIIVTQEARSVEEEIDGLARIKALPRVLLAEPVVHHFEPETTESTQGAGPWTRPDESS